jgi:hypothetical protein
VPRFSVVVPTYNTAEVLRECLAGLLAQTYEDWEAVVVDDGSTDATPAVVEEFAARDSRLRPLRQPNAGVAAARNAGIVAARGEWIALLDGDDHYFPWALATLAGLTDAWPEAGIVCGGTTVEASAEPPAAPGPDSRVMDAFYAVMAFESETPPLSMQSAALRRDVVARVGGFDGSYYEDDSHFWVRATASTPVAYTHHPIARWRVGEAVTRTDRFTATTQPILDALRMFRALADDPLVRERLAARGEESRFERLMRVRAGTLETALALREGREAEAAQALAEAWRGCEADAERDRLLRVLGYYIYYPRQAHAEAAARAAGWLLALASRLPSEPRLAAALRERASDTLFVAAGRVKAARGKGAGLRLGLTGLRRTPSMRSLRSLAHLLRR